MTIERMAGLANIVALLPGGYCAYGTYVLLHPPTTTAASAPSANAPSGLITAFVIAGCLLAIAAILNFIASVRTPKQHLTAQDLHRGIDPFKSPRWELVSGHSFVNETVEIDGKSFRNCSFENVRLMFHGTAPVDMQSPTLVGGKLIVETDHAPTMFYVTFRDRLMSLGNGSTQALNEKGKAIAAQPLIVVSADPMIYLDIPNNADLLTKTTIMLQNHGGAVAHNVKIQDLTVRGRNITFDSVAAIGATTTVALFPDISGNPFSNTHDLLSALRQDWEVSTGELTHEYPWKLVIDYEDVLHHTFRSNIDLMYYPVQDLHERNKAHDWPKRSFRIVEVKSIEIMRLS
jgi:hypothetical protein